MKGLTIQQTEDQITWAIAQWNKVCNVNLKWSGTTKRGLTIYGQHPLTFKGELWKGGVAYNYKDFVIFDKRAGYAKIRPRIMGGVCIHEIGHWLGWDHCCKDGDLMNNLNIFDWFKHDDIIRAQKRFGKPKQEFWPYPVRDWGARLREVTTEIKVVRARLLKARDDEDWILARRLRNEFFVLRDKRTPIFSTWRSLIAEYKNTPKAKQARG